jgi:hypothetical protein
MARVFRGRSQVALLAGWKRGYNVFMAAKLNKELADALHAAGGEGLEVIDPDTNRVYRIIDEETHREAMLALRAQQDRDAIAEGIAQMEAGEGKPALQAFEEMRERLGFPEEL